MSTTVLGANLGFFSYYLLKSKLYWYYAAPLAFSVYFVSRNLMMRNCIDRIYYPGEAIYHNFRNDEKQKDAVNVRLN